ncbi:MAG: threonine--tRNA ligase [Clostridia bacterium]|nr:threonine--tRNA ligase [Clostridia bacterium]
MKVIYNNGTVDQCPEAEELEVLRHSAAHIMAQAVQRLYPHAKFAYGPATEKGFYYDVDLGDVKLVDSDLAAIEAEMKKIVKENLPIKPEILPRDEAIRLMEEKGEVYKVEHIADLEDSEPISFYRQGDYVDMCRGPHITYTKALKAFKLTSISGAYWKNDSNNKMLTRIYGTAFATQPELDEYLKAVEEAKMRDHNKIGRELEYFTTVESIGQGLPIMLPKGARTIQLLQRFVEDEEQRRGYLLTKTPLMAKRELYKISGHWDHYLDGMFILGDPNDEEKECFALRPMTCPFQYQVFLNKMRSYRDLPMRLGETSTLFRNEDSGEMHGLIRVRQFTISEGHLILRPEQLEDEFRGCLELANYMLKAVGLDEDVSYRFSQWDPERKDKYEGTPEQWNEAQSLMGKILDNLGLKYSIGVDEAAFYGPKLDIQIKNVHGKEDTLITIQIDMLLAKKFGMEYVDVDGEKKTPYIIHRTSLGCYERTLALLLEKYAGAMPTWLAPEQVRIIPISERLRDEAMAVTNELQAKGFKVSCDDRNEKMGYRIREAQLEKIPYMLIIGDKEIETNTVSVRKRGGVDLGSMSLDDFAAMLREEIDTLKIDR